MNEPGRPAARRSEARADLLVRGGLLVDGTGGPARRADLAVREGRILAVGDLVDLAAARVIDAAGLVVAPGFFDIHSHADLILLGDAPTRERLLQAKLRQGVTSLVVGNCGLGAAPASAAAARILDGINGWMSPDGVRAGAMSTAAYLARLEDGGVPLNVGSLVPHGPLRFSAMGASSGPPSRSQLAAMRRDLRDGLDAGAFGLSAGLIYPPGMYSDTAELADLAGVVAESERLFTSHVRGSSETLLHAAEELIEIGRSSGARVHHSHLEAVGRRFWPRVEQVLALEDRARREGVRISHDVFPYTRAATMMSAVFPPWSLEGGLPALLERLADPATRERIRVDVEHRVPDWPPWQEGGWPHNLVEAVGWDGILVGSVRPDGPADQVGRRLSDLSTAQRRHPFDVVADLMLSQRGQVGQLVDEVSGRDDSIDALLSILTHPAAAIVSDAEDYGRGTPHPAHAGAFARAFRLSRELSLLSLEELVHRMTGYPASLIGVSDRGTLQPGHHADLTLFDPDGIADRATWDAPRTPAAGIPHVIINGTSVVSDGNFLGGQPGHVLRA